jgi:hypothetical protein
LQLKPRLTRWEQSSAYLQSSICFAKKVTAAFDGGRLSSDGGVMLLALADRRRDRVRDVRRIVTIGTARRIICTHPVSKLVRKALEISRRSGQGRNARPLYLPASGARRSRLPGSPG